jgi:ubiquinone/menaquinone biosynthesis C-methylase UbiE
MVDQQEQVTEYFSKNPKSYADSYGQVTAEGYSFRVRRERLLELLGSGNGKRVLDIGCGPGVMTEEIIELGWNYTGCDISESMIEEAKRRYPGVAFQVGAVEKISAVDATYDAVVAMGLVEYVTSDRAAIEEMRRVLKPGGVLIVSLPNWWSPPRMWDRWIIVPLSKVKHSFGGTSKPNVFHREYREGSYVKLLTDEKFKIDTVVYYNFRLLLRPFDYKFGKFAVKTAAFLEKYRNTPIHRWATGLLVKATRQ